MTAVTMSIGFFIGAMYQLCVSEFVWRRRMNQAIRATRIADHCARVKLPLGE